MIALGEVTNMFQQGWASLRRLQEIFDATPAVDDPIDAVTTPIRGGVGLRNVYFAYGQSIVLRTVSFHVPAACSLAIVGRARAGRSSPANLIPRLFDVHQVVGP